MSKGARSKNVDSKPAAPPDAARSALHVIWGNDEFLVAREARASVERLCADRENGLDVIDGAVDTVDEMAAALGRTLDSLQTMGLFASERLVWLRDAAFLGDAAKLKSEGVAAALAALGAELERGLLPGVTLVVSCGKLDRRTAFYKLCERLGQLREFNLPEKSWQMDEYAREIAAGRLREAGVRAGEDALDELAAIAGTDSRQLAQEIDKLILYLGGKPQVTAQDVREIVSPAREAAGWDLADAFGRRDLGSALRHLKRLLFQKESLMGLVAAIENRIRDLLILRICLDRRWVRLEGSGDFRRAAWPANPDADQTLASLPADPRSLNPYRAGKLLEQAGRFSAPELARLQATIVETHEKMLSSPVPGELLLELFLIRSVPGERRRETA